MRIGFAVIVALCSCYAPKPQLGVPCDPLAPMCPSGQTCEPSAGGFACTRGGGDGVDAADNGGDAGESDVDGDTIPDAVDNCPQLANANQANEDGDASGDLCDACPPFVDTTDSDDDTVPDACDPHPTEPGDTITLFEGFADGLPLSWSAAGAWTAADGTLTSTDAGAEDSTLVIPYTGTANQTIYSIATITALANNLGASIGIVDRFDDAGSVGVHCGGARSFEGRLGLINVASGAFIDAVDHPFAVGQVYRLRLSRDEARYACTDLEGTPRTVSASPGITGGSFIGFRTRTASSTFPWIMVVKSQ
jgi:hypothetical protein